MQSRKELILENAMQLLGEEGLRGITMRNLAVRQAISEPAIYKQFKNKNEIIKSIVREYASYDTKIQDAVSDSKLGGRAAILDYVRSYAELYESYYQLTTVMLSMDLYFYDEETKQMKEDIQLSRTVYLSNLIKECEDRGEVKEKLDHNILAMSIEAIIYKEVLDWRLKNMRYSLKDSVLHIIEAFI